MGKSTKMTFGDRPLMLDWELNAIQREYRTWTHPGNSVARWLNHSCRPNCKIGADGVSVITIEPVPAWKELTIDYGTAELVDCIWECFCGAPECRGRDKFGNRLPVGGFVSKLPHERKRDYERDLLSPYVRSEYESGWIRHVIAPWARLRASVAPPPSNQPTNMYQFKRRPELSAELMSALS